MYEEGLECEVVECRQYAQAAVSEVHQRLGLRADCDFEEGGRGEWWVIQRYPRGLKERTGILPGKAGGVHDGRDRRTRWGNRQSETDLGQLVWQELSDVKVGSVQKRLWRPAALARSRQLGQVG